jgi:archaellum component FlaC
MPRKPTAHARLDQIRKDAADERVRARDVDAELEAAKQRVEDISDDLT